MLPLLRLYVGDGGVPECRYPSYRLKHSAPAGPSGARRNHHNLESQPVRVGDDFLVTGATTGVFEGNVSEIRVDLKPVGEAVKGTYCSIPITFTDDWKGERKLRRGDKFFIWKED